jgi:hypothetical protein
MDRLRVSTREPAITTAVEAICHQLDNAIQNVYLSTYIYTQKAGQFHMRISQLATYGMWKLRQREQISAPSHERAATTPPSVHAPPSEIDNLLPKKQRQRRTFLACPIKCLSKMPELD